MSKVQMAPVTPRVAELESVYGLIDLGPDGVPRETWEARQLYNLRLEAPLQSPWFPKFWYRRVRVNRRMADAISAVLHEINARYTPEFRANNGLDQFLKCYCFGNGMEPSLFWYGAAWRLSPQVGGSVLADTSKIFTRHGFSIALGGQRDFEYW
jgi:hypothetical protein